MKNYRAERGRRSGSRATEKPPAASTPRRRTAPVKLTELPPVDLSPHSCNRSGNPWSGKRSDVSRET